MRATDALVRLRNLGKPVLTSEDAALRLGMTRPATSRTLERLEAAGLAQRLRHGLWAVDRRIDPYLLPEYLTAPFPAYVSFQSALYHHGMISQVPQVIYVASLAPTRQVKTRVGTYSIHRLSPPFFGGYETLNQTGVRLARPEKALLDILYLAPARSRLFAHLPELEIPPRFNRREAWRWVARIPARYRRTMVKARLERILGSRGPGPGRRGRSTPRRPVGPRR